MSLIGPVLARLSGLLGHWLLRSWGNSLEFRFVLDDPDCLPHRMPCPGMYVFWHEMLLFPAYTHPDIAAPLVSRSRDGEFISQIISFSRGSTIRGSTDGGRAPHGGRQAVWEMVKAGRQKHLAMTVDAPIGPSRKVSRGSVVIALRHGMPMIPLGFGVRKCWYVGPRTRRIVCPYLGSRVWAIVGPRIQMNRQDPQASQRSIQAALDDVQLRAERLARGEISVSGTVSLDAMRNPPDEA